jgi:hypothetical protein
MRVRLKNIPEIKKVYFCMESTIMQVEEHSGMRVSKVEMPLDTLHELVDKEKGYGFFYASEGTPHIGSYSLGIPIYESEDIACTFTDE